MFTPCARSVTYPATRSFLDFGVLSAIVSPDPSVVEECILGRGIQAPAAGAYEGNRQYWHLSRPSLIGWRDGGPNVAVTIGVSGAGAGDAVRCRNDQATVPRHRRAPRSRDRALHSAPRRSPHRPDANGVVTARHGPAAQPSSIVRWLAMSSSPSSPGRSVNCSVTAVALSFHRKATFTITCS